MFYTRTVHYPETLEHLAQGHRLTLVCSPVHLERLPDPLHTTQLAGRIGRVFSAGAPLTAVAASHCQRYFGVPATEIYGSSETGAVAWREQLTTSLWQCLPGVVVDNSRGSRQLCIHSPALADDQGLEVSDLGEVHSPTTFSLGGRVDRIAKVGGKRVSLTALETALASHHWVRVARVVPLSARKNRLGAVIVLEKDGNEALIDRGRRVINSQLRDHIAGPLEPIALPRYWRYVAKLPVNSQGKTTLDALVDLFVEERQSRYPVMIDSEELAPASHYRLHLQIPANLYYFNGHFPGRPVLPGVVQTHWAIHFARELFPDLGEFAGLEAIKFQHIIQPDALVSLDLQWQSVRNKLLFSYQSTHACHSSGRVLFSNGAGQ
jgi:3-hydroxymyristoyl/3-hydroxydecanoyl-(acyl carrier protein) dehydratase